MTGPAARILIVDDEPQNCKLLETLLRPEGYLTVSAASGEAAFASISQHTPDLILLDVMMPGMDGYQVASRLKASSVTSHIPIILVSALADRSARLAGLDAGAEEYLTKPIDRAELWLRVRNLLRLKAFSDFLKNHSTILEQQVEARATDLLRFRAAMDATADAIFLVSRNSMRFIEINATAVKMLGYTRDELFELGPSQLGAAAPVELEAMYDALIAGHRTNQLSETKLRRKDGSVLQVEVHRHAQRTGTDWTIVDVVRDITERKEAEKRLHHLAHYDALTSLPNRTLLYDNLKKTLAQAVDSDWIVAVLCIDLDHFKIVNDTLGHVIGDELLVQFSNRLVKCVRIRDTVARVGGDEFTLVLVLQNGQQDAAVIANKIREALSAPFDLKGHEVAITASIGIAIHPLDAADSDTLIKYADTAMYRAKQAGRDAYRFFTAEMNAEVSARLDLETALRKAVENEEFVLHYQPQVQLDSGLIVGLEALLRWQRPGHGLVPPKDFIALLEETGLIVRVGAWVIATVCKQIATWIRSSVGPIHVSVNVSGRQFVDRDLYEDVVKAIGDSGIPADLLELELTESSLMVNTGRTIANLDNLKKLGVQISIDDFGTGYSSLAYVRRFPIDKLKIDVSFVRDITTDSDAAAMALAIVRMAHSLKLEVVAEGVETAAQLAYLRRLRCDQIQGYYFSRPLPLPELEEMLRERNSIPVPVSDAGAPLKTLLLIDDEPDVLTVLRRLLCQDGYHILSAQSAAEGFELLAQHSVQVILCDQVMPGMCGTDFLDRVMGMYPDTVRIILSGHNDLESSMDAINRGAIHRFYTKQLDKKILRESVREAFRYHWVLRDVPLDQCDADVQMPTSQ